MSAQRILTVERLSNGFISVYDRSCQWQALYNADGTYRAGATDSPAYRAAVTRFIAQGAASFAGCELTSAIIAVRAS